MKKIFLSVMTLVLFAGMGLFSASAQVVDTIDVTIPFDFTIQETSLPAGSYSIKRVSSTHQRTMIVRNAKGKNVLIFLANTTHSTGTSDGTSLVFNVVGNRYFLSQIFEGGNNTGVAVVKSDTEKQLEQELSGIETRVVIVKVQSR
jgi:hypothetical protein